MQKTEIKEGEMIYYLNVPNDNDWINIEVKPNKGTGEKYNPGKYEGFFVSRSSEHLKILASHIKMVFSDPSDYEQAEINDGCFFRVYVSNSAQVCTVNYGKGEGTIFNQKAYRNNCFKNEEDAQEAANRICNILGLPQVKHDK